MRRSRLVACAAGALTLACMLQATSCGDPTYILEGRFYLASRDCLGTTSTIDVVSGEEPGTCPPTCLVQKSYDGGRATYVTTMCGPYPFDLEASGADPTCAAAIAAFQRNDTCQTDGGSTAPAPRDAGAARD